MIIYKVTNNITGFVYIGKTKNDLETRWKQHCRDARCRNDEVKHKFQYAILEYGSENFTVEQIDVAATKEEANLKETYWIRHYDSIKNGYNTSPGGKNGGNFKKIMNVETGEVFDSIKSASEKIKRSCTGLALVVDRSTLKCGGYHWKSVK